MDAASTIAINRVHFPVTTLGPGRRLALWTQGCSIRCSGCVSRDTWTRGPEHAVELNLLLERIRPWLRQADGLTITGGEPLDQPIALKRFLERLRAEFDGDILVYSGYAWERIAIDHGWVQGLVDACISEPFDASTGSSRIWRGSDNQRVHLLTDLGRSRMGGDVDERPWPATRGLDLCVGENEVWMAGIPRPGDLERLRLALMRRGFESVTSSASSLECRA